MFRSIDLSSTNFKDRKNHFYEIMIYELPEPPAKAVFCFVDSGDTWQAKKMLKRKLSVYFSKIALLKKTDWILPYRIKRDMRFTGRNRKRGFMTNG
ncbi:MAG: hypothetical protein KH347_04800 [Acetobacter sp.]|nr:hypothetical protein [Acetobacter sp.]